MRKKCSLIKQYVADSRLSWIPKETVYLSNLKEILNVCGFEIDNALRTVISCNTLYLKEKFGLLHNR